MIFSCRVVEKPWGSELIIADTPDYIGKLISINEGARLSMQYHNLKSETIHVLEGELLLIVDEGFSRHVEQGQSIDVPAGTRHRFCGVTKVLLIEVSTPQIDDVVRLEDDYGR